MKPEQFHTPQPETQEVEPKNITLRAFLLSSNSDLPEELKEQLEKLSGSSREKLNEFKKGNKKYKLLNPEEKSGYSEAIMNIAAINHLRDELDGNDYSAVLVVGQEESGTISAFTTAYFKKVQYGRKLAEDEYIEAEDDYIRVDPQHRRKGLGKMMLAIRNRMLFQQGIKRYKTSLTTASYGMYQRLQSEGSVSFDTLDDKPLTGIAKLRVYIKGDELQNLFSNLNLNFEQNPNEPYKANL